MSVYNKNGSELSSVFSKDGVSLPSAYDMQGNRIFGGSVDYSKFSVSNYCSVSISQMQGFDIWGDYIFQFRANSSSVSNIMCTINSKTNSIVQNGITATSDHGDSASFSSERYSSNDQFPLLYVTADTTPCKVYVNRVTLTSSQNIRTLLFPTEKAGYYAAHAYDELSKTMYIVGYSERNYQTDGGGTNKTLVSVWDMNNLTNNGDGTYTPTFVRSFERAFIYVMQGQQYHDGLIWISSGYGSRQSYIYAISPVDGALIHTIDLETTVEVEGLSFISNTEMVVGLQGGTYKKYTFALKEDTA